MFARRHLLVIWLALAPSVDSVRGADAEVRPHDRLARLVSPSFRDLDDRREQLRQGPPPFRPPLTRGPTLGYHSAGAESRHSPRWVQVDLGEVRPLDAVVVVPAAGPARPEGGGYFFPLRFRVELAKTADMADAVLVADYTAADYPNPGWRPVIVPIFGQSARFVRFIATRLDVTDGLHFFALGELVVVSGALNVAAGRPVTASDSIENFAVWGKQNLVDSMSVLGPPLGREPSPTNGYQSKPHPTPRAVKWVQVDLGEPRPLDEVRLVPARPSDFPDRSGYGFPSMGRVEASNTPAFENPIALVDSGTRYINNVGDGPMIVPARGVTARYVRLTATRLWERSGDHVLALAELQVYSGGQNVARGAPVDALDSEESPRWGKAYLVDGLASQHQLLEWPEWLAAQAAQADREAEGQAVEAEWEAARARAYDTLVYGAVGTGGLGLVVTLGVWWRARLARRREIDRLRSRISRDLHDEVGSNLGSILLLAQSAVGGDEEAARRDLGEIARVAHETAESMRDLVWLMGSGRDPTFDLLVRLRETAATLLTGVEYTFNATDDCLPRQAGLEFKRQVLLAFKEAVHNVARHARAQSVGVRCWRDGRRFCLEVQDDGKGFDPARPGRGTGLRGLQARAQALSGNLRLDSRPGGGTTVRLTVPFA